MEETSLRQDFLAAVLKRSIGNGIVVTPYVRVRRFVRMTNKEEKEEKKKQTMFILSISRSRRSKIFFSIFVDDILIPSLSLPARRFDGKIDFYLDAQALMHLNTEQAKRGQIDIAAHLTRRRCLFV